MDDTTVLRWLVGGGISCVFGLWLHLLKKRVDKVDGLEYRLEALEKHAAKIDMYIEALMEMREDFKEMYTKVMELTIKERYRDGE